MTFDPYYQWLGIPPDEQPPHHYRLLGIKPLEENLDVIETAADRQMLQLRTYQSGKHAEVSQALLNEISAAKIALLDPAKKLAYDAALKTKLTAAKPAGAAQTELERPLAPRPLPVAMPLVSAPIAPHEQPFPGPSAQRASPALARRRSNSSMMLVAGGVVALVVLAVGAIIALSMLGNDQAEIAAQTSTNTGGDDSGSNIEVERPEPVMPLVMPPTEPVTSVVPPTDEPEIPSPEAVETDPPVDVPQEVDPQDDPVAEPPEIEPSAVGGSDEPKKLPVPEKGVREAKRQEILAIFPIADVRTPEAKNQLSTKLIATARSSETDADAQFALLNLAREQAAEAGDLKLAFEAIDLLAEKFDFDADAVRVTSVQQASKAVVPPVAKREIVVAGMGVVEQLVAADKFDAADTLSEQLLTVARPLRDNELMKSIVERRRALGDQAATYRRVQAAFDTLTKLPDDPGANLAAGRYLTFVKQDWGAGLAHLAKGSDELLAAAANAELTDATAPVGEEKLADAWWDAAETQKEAHAKAHCRARAGYWYREIVDRLSGLAKVKVEKRIAAAGEITVIAPAGALTAGRIMQRDCLVYFTFEKDTFIQDDSGAWQVLDQSENKNHGVYHHCYPVEGFIGGAMQLDGRQSHTVIPNVRNQLLGQPTVSIVGWCKPGRREGRGFIFSTGFHGSRSIDVSVMDGNLEFLCLLERGGSGLLATLPAEDRWMHFACVADGRTMRTYTDGKVAGEQAIDIAGFDNTNLRGESAHLGAQAKEDRRSGRYYDGLLDEFAVLKRALTQAEITTLYQAGAK